MNDVDRIASVLPSEADCERIRRYVAGQSTAEDDSWVTAWVAADPRRRALVERARLAYDPKRLSGPRGWDTQAAWKRFWEREEAPSTGAAVLKLSPTRHPPPRRAVRGSIALAVRVAAVILIAVAGGALLWRAAGGPRAEYRSIATLAGQHARVQLSDGTLVTLAPESRLRYPSRFSGNREVDLQGEAYFDVASRDAAGFTVRARGSTTRVLGTEFAVRARAEEPYIDVVVAEGAVDFGSRDGGTRTELHPGQRARLDRDGGLTGPVEVDLAQALAWLDGWLVFENAPLAEVVQSLQRRYGVRIVLADSTLAGVLLTAQFRGNDPAEAVQLLSFSLDLEAVRTSDGYLIRRAPRGRGESNQPPRNAR